MDGTLVNSIAAAESMWTRLADQAGLPAAEVIRYSHGRQIADSVARFLPEFASRSERITRQLMREELEEAAAVTEIAGAAALMTALIDNGVPVALVTSAVRELALARMHYAGVPIPPVVVTAEDVDNGKPAPDAYLQAAALLGVPTARCVVFEDAEAGLRSARASGAQVVVVGDHLTDHRRSDPDPRLSRNASAVDATEPYGLSSCLRSVHPRAPVAPCSPHREQRYS